MSTELKRAERLGYWEKIIFVIFHRKNICLVQELAKKHWKFLLQGLFDIIHFFFPYNSIPSALEIRSALRCKHSKFFKKEIIFVIRNVHNVTVMHENAQFPLSTVHVQIWWKIQRETNSNSSLISVFLFSSKLSVCSYKLTRSNIAPISTRQQKVDCSGFNKCFLNWIQVGEKIN